MFSSKTIKLITTSLIILSLSGCIIHVGGQGGDGINFDGVSSVFGDLDVGEGKLVGDVSAVNGNIKLANNVEADRVDTVNGDIAIGNQVRIVSAETVNGNIQVGTNLIASQSLSTVNGDIDVKQNGKVDGSVSTVNGDITLRGTKIGSDLVTSNGDISLSQGTYIKGDIVFKRQQESFFKSRGPKPTLYIAADVQLDGQIILERDVILKLDSPQLQEKVLRHFADE